jgi:hypothetical protein
VFSGMTRIALALALLLPLTACSFAFGTHQQATTMGMAFGTAPGVGYFHIKNPANDAVITKTGRVLRLPMDIKGRGWSLDIGVEFITVYDAAGVEHTYRAWPDLLLRRRIELRSGTNAVAGGGLIIGCIDGRPLLCGADGGIPAKALRGTLALEQVLGEIMFGPVELRLEAAAEAGQSSVRQLNVTGGFIFWFDVRKDFFR